MIIRCNYVICSTYVLWPKLLCVCVCVCVLLYTLGAVYVREKHAIGEIRPTNIMYVFSPLIVYLCCRHDLFLVSQSVCQGTVSPTHFNVTCNTTGLEPDCMQQRTYKLCHLY